MSMILSSLIVIQLIISTAIIGWILYGLYKDD